MLSYALFPKVALQFFDNRAKGIVPADPAAPAAQPAAPAAQAAAPATGGSATYTINVNGQAFSVQVSVGGAPQQAVAAPATSAAPAPAPAAPAPAGGGTTVTSPLPGSVFSLKVAVGDQVSEGDVVIIMESMKMETEIHATANGSISSIQVQEGQNVKTDDPLLVIG
jgi:oxaloacetate decarboxylase alpha subunit